jgi:MFS family permease
MTSLIKSNKSFRSLFFSRIFNEFGASLFNIAFLVYAAGYNNATIYISLAAITAALPNFLPAFTGFLADKTPDKKRAMFLSSWLQTGLFLFMAMLVSFRSMPVFLICCLINIMSDLLASYKSGLQMPIIQARVSKKEIQTAFGAFQGLASVFQLVGQPLGVALLALFQNSFMTLSLINAGSYFLSGLVLLESRKYLDIDFQQTTESFQFNLKKIWQDVQSVFAKDGSKSGTSLIFCVLLMNFIANGILAMIELAMKDYNPFGNNYGFAVMVFNVAFSLGIFSGSILMNDLLKKSTLRTILLLMFPLYILFAMTLTNLGLLAAAVLFAIGYVFAKVNPKFSSYMMAVVAAENLAKVAGSITTLFASFSSAGIFVFVALANIISVPQTLMVLSVLAFLTLLFLAGSARLKRL